MGKVVRGRIEGYATGLLKPLYLGKCLGWMIPSTSDLGAYYIVVQSRVRGWACCCKGFRFSKVDHCTHVEQAQLHLKRRLKRKGKVA